MKLAIGDRVQAQVTHGTAYGFHLEFEGIPGLLQIPEITWFVDEPWPAYAPGDTITVMVIALSEERFSASLRELTPEDNPWKDPARFAAGTRHQAIVHSIASYGVFVKLARGVFAMIKAATDVHIGASIPVVVLVFEIQLHRIECAMVSSDPP